jgi:hypothetical protein
MPAADQPPHVPPYQPPGPKEAESVDALLTELGTVRTASSPIGQFSAAARIGRKISAHPDFTNPPLPCPDGNR